MNKKFEHIGGNIWSLIHKDECGYDYSKISVELERGKQPFVFNYSERYDISCTELQLLANLISDFKDGKL